MVEKQYEMVVCGTCFAMVPKREMHRHTDWHKKLEERIKGEAESEQLRRRMLHGRL